MDNKIMIASAVASVLALGTATIASASSHGSEKCYGIVKAGMNDCGSAGHACAGQSTQDADKGEWIYLPKGTCAKIVGGSLSKVSAEKATTVSDNEAEDQANIHPTE